MSTVFLLIVDVFALYLSTLMGPAPGIAILAVSQVYIYHVESENSSVSSGFLSTDVSYSSPCTLSQNSMEAPLQTGGPESADLYTVCSATAYGGKMNVLAKTSILGSQTYRPLEYTSLFQNSTVSRLATDNGTTFYILSRREGGNSSVWTTAAGGDAVLISDTQDDGWQLQHLTLLGSQLFAVGNQLGNPARSILFWGRAPPNSKQPPQRYPGLAGNSPTLLTFAFSDPTTLWMVNGASAAGGTVQLLLYNYTKQPLAWTVGGYYLFNSSFPVPTALFLGARPSIVKFYGVAATQLMEFTLPVPTAGGTMSSVILTRTISVPERGKQFRGLVGSNWIVPSPTPSATWSSTATVSASASSAATVSMSSTSSVSTTSTSAPTVSSIYTASTTPTPTATPTLPSVSSSTTMTTTSTMTSTPTGILSLGSSASLTPTAMFTSTGSPTPTPSPTPTATKSNTTAPDASAAANQGFTEGEKLSLGFGLTALIAALVGCVVLYRCYKSGKLFTLFLKKPTPRNYPSSGKVRDRPRSLAPVQLNINPAHLAKLNETRISMRVAEEQTQITKGGKFTVKKIKRTYAPMRVDVEGALPRTLSPLTNRMGTSV